MTEASRTMFQQVLGEIDKSRADSDLKDQTKGLIFQVMKFNNGSSNDVTDMKDALTLMSVFLIRHTLRSTMSDQEARAQSSRLGSIVLALKPVAWPICVLLSIAFFSPHFGEFMQFLKQLAGN